MSNEKKHWIGKRIPPRDLEDKVTGRTVFSYDFSLPGMLYARILRSPHAHARITKLDTSKAKAYPGVRAVVTAKDAPDTRFGISFRDERFFAKDEVHYVGDEVAAVVAVDEKTAEQALGLIVVTYDPLPAIFDPVEACQPGAPLARLDVKSNICHHTEVSQGDLEQGFKDASVILEDTFVLPHQYQCYIEPHAAVAQWQNGRVTIWAPRQAPRQLEKVVCEAFDLQRGAFQFVQTYVGGAFGGKTHMRVAPFAALLAKIVKAPVRLALKRDEDFQACHPSVPMVIKLKMGIDAAGFITAKDMHIIADNGAFSASAIGVVEVAIQRVDTLYHFKNVFGSCDLVYTNKLSTSAFSGYGNSQVHFAVKSMMDMLAEKIGMDPVEIRLKNATQAGDVTVHGWVISSCGLSDAIKVAAREAKWSEKRHKMRDKWRGIGIACGMHVSGSSTVSPMGASAQVRVHGDGTLHVATSEGDIGQGANSVYTLITAEKMEIPPDRIFIDRLNTDVSNFGVGAIGSRVTVLGGSAVHKGAVEMRRKLAEVAAGRWQCQPEDVQYSKGVLFNPKSEESMDLIELAAYYYDKTDGGGLSCMVNFQPQGLVHPDAKKYGNISLGYAFAAHVAEVEVDPETGRVDVLNYVAVHDSGQVINLLTAEGQVEGAISTGMGYALKEEYIFRDGAVLNPDFTNYRMPTSMDTPPMKVIFLDVVDPNGPFGAKSLGEVSMVPVAPALINALYDATGVRMTEIPATPEKVLWAIRGLGSTSKKISKADRQVGC